LNTHLPTTEILHDFLGSTFSFLLGPENPTGTLGPAAGDSPAIGVLHHVSIITAHQ